MNRKALKPRSPCNEPFALQAIVVLVFVAAMLGLHFAMDSIAQNRQMHHLQSIYRR